MVVVLSAEKRKPGKVWRVQKRRLGERSLRKCHFVPNLSDKWGVAR